MKMLNLNHLLTQKDLKGVDYRMKVNGKSVFHKHNSTQVLKFIRNINKLLNSRNQLSLSKKKGICGSKLEKMNTNFQAQKSNSIYIFCFTVQKLNASLH